MNIDGVEYDLNNMSPKDLRRMWNIFKWSLIIILTGFVLFFFVPDKKQNNTTTPKGQIFK